MPDHTPPPNTPVIVGVGEAIDRPQDLREVEPARLMEEALRSADRDSGARLLQRLEALDTIAELSWPYEDAAGVVSSMLGIAPAHTENGPIGGESPIRYLHRAALRIQRGEIATAAICGAEAEYSVRRARREGRVPDWTAQSSRDALLRSGDRQRPIVRALEASLPINVYPLYENAARAAWGQSLAEAQQESELLWASLSAVASGRAASWQQRTFTAAEIGRAGPSNRMIAWPYPKLMVANPVVNQGAAILLSSYETAIAAGADPARLIFLHGGAAANEPEDLLLRRDFTSSWAMQDVLAQSIGAAAPAGFDLVELYSCFPVVPKLARRALRLDPSIPISVTGGLTFFGAPLNNYMGHAIVAMTEALRGRGSGLGLLYGQGGYVTKHHAITLSTKAPEAPLADESIVPRAAPTFAGPVHEHHDGPAIIETFTILFDRDGEPRHGIVVARTPDGGRTIAKVPQGTAAIEKLLAPQSEPVGMQGRVVSSGADVPIFAC